MFVIAIYTVFTLFWLTLPGFISDDAEPVDDKILGAIDSYFLWLFLIEILLKSFASSLMYLSDKFN